VKRPEVFQPIDVRMDEDVTDPAVGDRNHDRGMGTAILAQDDDGRLAIEDALVRGAALGVLARDGG
jgi:hypothetical protein